MHIKPIKNEKDYQKTLKQIENIWDSTIGSPEGDILEILTILVEDYERTHYKIYLQ